MENIHEIVKKLVGNIQPIGETNTDERNFQNLELMTKLMTDLTNDIERVYLQNKDGKEFSVKRACDFAKNYLDTDKRNQSLSFSYWLMTECEIQKDLDGFNALWKYQGEDYTNEKLYEIFLQDSGAFEELAD